MRNVFTNMFQNRLEHARQCRRFRQSWRHCSGFRLMTALGRHVIPAGYAGRDALRY